MKKKFICLLLVFTVFFSSVNFSFANDYIEPLFLDGGVVSAPIVATIATIAVSAGVVLTTNDDVLDIVKIFYDNVRRTNEDIENIFKSCVFIASNGVVTVGKEFLDLCNSVFDKTFSYSDKMNLSSISTYGGLLDIGSPSSYASYFDYCYSVPSSEMKKVNTIGNVLRLGDFFIQTTKYDSPNVFYDIYYKGSIIHSYNLNYDVFVMKYSYFSFCIGFNGRLSMLFKERLNSSVNRIDLTGRNILSYVGSVSLPYVPGSYDWDKIKDNQKGDGSLDIFVPGNVGSLPGVVGGGTIAKPGINPPYELPNDGSVVFPGVSNPSIDVDGDVTFPNVSVPGELCPECGATVGTHNPGCSLDKPISPPGDLFPPWGGGIDFSPVTGGKFTEKFPFSLASDVGNILDTFNVPPKAPIFKVPIVSEELTVDLTEFTVWANIVRYFVLLGFVICLINITRKVIG